MPRCITKQLRKLPPQDAEVHYSLFVSGWSLPGCQPDLQAAAVSPLLQAQVCSDNKRMHEAAAAVSSEVNGVWLESMVQYTGCGG